MAELTLYLPARSAGPIGTSTVLNWRKGLTGPLSSGPLAAIPKGSALRVVLDARDAWLGQLELPPLSGKRLRKALPGAIEERLAVDPDSMHVALSDGVADAGAQGRCVAAVDRAWFAGWMARLEQAGLRPRSVIPLPFALPVAENTWTLRLLDGAVALRMGKRHAAGCAVVDDDSARVFVEQCIVKFGAPKRLIVQAADANLGKTLARNLAPLVTEVGFEPPRDADGLAPVDLLQFEFARGARWFKRAFEAFDARTRWNLIGLSAAILLTWLIGLNVDWFRRAHEARTLKDSVMTQFKQTFPNVPAVLDPVLQMRREVARLRAASGEGSATDALPMMARVSPVLAPFSAQLDNLTWRGGELKVVFMAGALANIRMTLDQQAGALGLTPTYSDDGLSVTFKEAR